ncbi:hypothetical protein F4781DRAFT_431013 [Annulohypoxylon bovei var. microspora]|nr:hypothetical protein F4781DRAFT_431013 [Annulohypoxylon bovei var. microspora]
MQFKFLAVSLFAAAAVAENNLTELVNGFPDCSLPCFAQSVNAKGCGTTDLSCICGKQVDITVKLGGCLNKYCDSSDRKDVPDKLFDLCDRYNEKPSSTEVAAATSALASHVTAASATVTPKSGAGSLEPGMVMAGAVAAAADL